MIGDNIVTINDINNLNNPTSIINQSDLDKNILLKKILQNTKKKDETENNIHIPDCSVQKLRNILLYHFILFIFGGILLYCYLTLKTENIYWLWTYIVSVGLLLYIVCKLFVFLFLNCLLSIFLYFGKIKFYYYTHSLNGNLNLIIWSTTMLFLSNTIFQDDQKNINLLFFNIQSIQTVNFDDILVCMIFIGLSNTARLIIVDSLLEIPSYDKFKSELEYFLKLSKGIHTIFGTYTEKNILSILPLPQEFQLPLNTIDFNESTDKKQILDSITVVKLESKKEARLVGKMLFNLLDNLDNNLGVNLWCIIELLDHNDPKFLEKKVVVEDTFKIINKNESGYISYEEFLNYIEEMFTYYNKLSHGLTTKKTVNKALEIIIVFCYIIIIIFICLLILKINIYAIYSSFAAFFALSAFGLSTSITRFVESILYITVYREFEVGDRVKIGEAMYIVKKIKLFNTIFIADSGGEIVYISNNVLISLTVQNLSKSTNAIVKIGIKVDNNVTVEKINMLVEKIGVYLKNDKYNWSLEYNIHIESCNVYSLSLTINLKHNLSWRHYNKVIKSKSDFLVFLHKTLKELNIESLV